MTKLDLAQLTLERILEPRLSAVNGPMQTFQSAHLQVIVHDHFPRLAPKLPTAPTRAALGYASKDRYWLHMFDALALALAIRGATQPSQALA